VSVPYDTAMELAQLSGLVLGEPDLDAALGRVVRVTVATVPSCDGASVTLRERGVPTAMAADDPWAEELDRLQVVEQEGPCLDCMREGSIMRVRDLVDDGRFPSYGPRAAELGARSVASFPLNGDAQVVGALNLYSRATGAFDTHDVALGTLLAAHASLALQAATAYYNSRDLAGRLQEATASRAVIEQAKGLIMGRRGCDADAAFAELVSLSQRGNVKLREVAQRLVDDARVLDDAAR
jgi:GAF domain-containing protein